jgi:hypothetical protein
VVITSRSFVSTDDGLIESGLAQCAIQRVAGSAIALVEESDVGGLEYTTHFDVCALTADGAFVRLAFSLRRAYGRIVGATFGAHPLLDEPTWRLRPRGNA